MPVTYKRLSPYVLVAIGRGVSRPNVNEFFPDRVTHTVTLQGPGFGARVRLTEHLSAFADIRFLFQSRRRRAGRGRVRRPSAAASPGDSERGGPIGRPQPAIERISTESDAAMARKRSSSDTGFTRCTSKPASAVRMRSCCWPQPVSAIRRDLLRPTTAGAGAAPSRSRPSPACRGRAGRPPAGRCGRRPAPRGRRARCGRRGRPARAAAPAPRRRRCCRRRRGSGGARCGGSGSASTAAWPARRLACSASSGRRTRISVPRPGPSLLRVDGAAVHLDQAAHQRQPDAEPALGAVAGRGGTCVNRSKTRRQRLGAGCRCRCP